MDSRDPAALQYPADFPIKVFLKPGEQAEAELIRSLEQCLNPGNRIQVERVVSRGGRYVCLRIAYVAQDAAEVARLRECLRSDVRVILSL